MLDIVPLIIFCCDVVPFCITATGISLSIPPSINFFEITPILSAFLPIFFEFDEFQLSDNNKGKLEELVHYLKLKPNLKIEIQGHTDERGTDSKNMELGKKRAKAVYDFLLLSGVNKNQLSFIAYGEKAPLCQEDNEKCWDQNNRV